LQSGSEFKDGDYTYMKVVPTEKKLDTDFCYKTNADNTAYGLFGNLEVTSDIDCSSANGVKHTYDCEGVDYCYGLTSPNTKLTIDGTLE
jgi:hypothetical protein